MKKLKLLISTIVFVLLVTCNESFTKAATVPAIPTNVKAVSAGFNSVRITWSSVKGAVGYQVSRAPSKSGPFKGIGFSSSTSLTNVGLTTNQTYYYKVRAYTLSGKTKIYGKFSPIYSAKPVIPTPGGVKAVSAGTTSTKITWASLSGISGYQVSRATDEKGPFKGIGFTSSNSFTNNGLITNQTYYYKVRAYRLSGKTKIYGRFSPIYSAKPELPTPGNVKVVSASTTSAKITWASQSGISGYQISRATEVSGPFKGITFATTNSYTDKNLKPGSTYFYKVRSYRTISGKKVYGKFSNIVSIKIQGQKEQGSVQQIGTNKIVGYYAAWSAYSGFTPDKVDGSKVTHINYAFANIGSDLRLTLGYPDIDLANFNKLRALKSSYPHIKTVISVGGWTWSGRFSDIALTEASRNTFADSCVNFIVTHGFDGVDIDWEYPVRGGLSTNSNRPEDKTNFTLLMKKIREKLNAQEAKDGKKYLLTFAGATSNAYLNNIEPAKLELYVDFVNVMSYDIHGTWDKYTDFNAPLYGNDDITLQYKGSADQSVNAWLNAGFPAQKVVMGVPFYGVLYKSVVNSNNGLYQTYSGGSSISYKNIVANYIGKPGYIRHFHAVSKVPWLFNGTNFISYDDEESIRLKGAYVKNKGLGGVMIWELSQDYNGRLLNALNNGLK